LLLESFKYLSNSDLAGRKTGTQGLIKARNYLIKQLTMLKVSPYKNSFTHEFTANNGTGHNVIGIIKGNKHFNKYIVLTAHYDHLGKKSGKIYNGADDNASGTAALLILAKALIKSPPMHNILLVFTDAEESGLKGAKAFIKQNMNILPDVKVNINLDMLSGTKQTKRLHFISRGIEDILSTKLFHQFKANQQFSNLRLVQGFRSPHNISLNKRVNWNMASDHGVFFKQKIPFIYFGVGIHRNYHTVNDTFKNSNLSLLVKAVNVIYYQLIFLDKNIS